MSFIRTAFGLLWRVTTLLVSIGFAAVALFDISARNAIDTHGVEANGFVLTPAPSAIRAGQVVIQYATQSGQTFTAKPVIAPRPDLQAGEPVTVMYIPHRPGVFAIEPRLESSAATISLAIAAIAAIPFLLWAWRSRHLFTPPRIVLGQSIDAEAKKAYSRRWAVTILIVGTLVLPAGKFIWNATDFSPSPASTRNTNAWQPTEATVVTKLPRANAEGRQGVITVSFKAASHGLASDDIRAEITVSSQVYAETNVGNHVFIRYNRQNPGNAVYGLADPTDSTLGLLALFAALAFGTLVIFAARHRLATHVSSIRQSVVLLGLVGGSLLFAVSIAAGLSTQFRWEFFTKQIVMGEITDYEVRRGTPYATFEFTTLDGYKWTRLREFSPDEIERPDDIAKGKKLPIVYLVASPVYNRPLFVEEQMAPTRKFVIAILVLMIIACAMCAAVGIAPLLDRLRGRGPGSAPTIPPSRMNRIVHSNAPNRG